MTRRLLLPKKNSGRERERGGKNFLRSLSLSVSLSQSQSLSLSISAAFSRQSHALSTTLVHVCVCVCVCVWVCVRISDAFRPCKTLLSLHRRRRRRRRRRFGGNRFAPEAKTLATIILMLYILYHNSTYVIKYSSSLKWFFRNSWKLLYPCRVT